MENFVAEDSKEFREPKLTINRVYTKQGDGGKTRLVGGQLIDKHDLRIECYGTVDELNAVVGACVVGARAIQLDALADILTRTQNTLFNLGAILATLPEDVGERMPRVRKVDVQNLESSIDEANEQLPALKSFVLPGGDRLNADLHLARTVCRRAERHCVRMRAEGGTLDEWSIPYLNRLSDALFVWSRYSSFKQGVAEVLWAPNEA
jgi:cob(I)alamin adenosyltransferase